VDAKRGHHMPVLVKKPISVLDRQLTVSWKGLWLALGKAAAHASVGNFDDLPSDLVDVGAAVGIVTDAGDAAWLLVRRSLGRALADLLRQHRDLFAGGAPLAAEGAMHAAGLGIDDKVFELDDAFFANPGALQLLDTLREPFAQWLTSYGLQPAASRAIAERLRPYFVLALHDEWGQRPSEYAKLAETVNTPFTRAQDLERAWLRYEAHLWHQVNEPMFAEAFGLRAVYMPLRGYWERTSGSNDAAGIQAMSQGGGDKPPGKRVRVVVDVERELNVWLDENQRDCNLRVLSGGPGSGKSSFARMYAAATMARGRVRSLYIPLHLFDLKSDLVAAVGEYISISRILPQNPLSAENERRPRRLLLVFDGLDELAMQGKLAADTARDFVRELDRTLEKLNQMTPWVSALVSGRELVIQANASELRHQRQVLHLLPYHVDAQRPAHMAGDWEDPKGLLRQDQRHNWWEKYRTATGLALDQIPAEMFRDELGEVTTQPLLLYLVALSFARGKLELGPKTNLNDVYGDLIEAVWERAYERQRFAGIRDLKCDQFRRVLEEIGLTAWHDESRTTTVGAIQRRFESAALSSLLGAFEQGAERGVTRLLAAFYFRQHGDKDGLRTFEFTHKSFGEYLAARRIVRTLQNIDRDMTDHEVDPDRGKDAVAALVEWIEICGPAALDQYYVRFLEREVRRHAPEDVRKWQQRLSQLLATAVSTGTPVERIKQRPATFQEELRRARNADEALFACVSACSDVTKEMTDVKWPTPTAAGEWLRRLQGQRPGAQNRVILASLRRLNLDDCRLDGMDLYSADLKFSSLGAWAYRAWLDQADLTGANLCGARLEGASLKGARLDDANLTDANLSGARLEDVSLVRAHLVGVELAGANLADADLSGSDLSGANLEGAHLEDADLSCANLEGAHLERANFARANLKDANLKDANFEGANLEGANLEGANLEGVNLEGVNLEGVNLEGVNLEGVNLEGASLRGFEGGTDPPAMQAPEAVIATHASMSAGENSAPAENAMVSMLTTESDA
jgi:uncharacterized protein YjbI with pentapeptide repeats